MTDQEIEADAWQRKDDAYYTYPPMWHMAVDTNYDQISRFKPLFSSETIREALKQASLELEGYCTDHDEWIWDEDHQCLNSRSCDIWQPKDGHIWADFAKEVFSQ